MSDTKHSPPRRSDYTPQSAGERIWLQAAALQAAANAIVITNREGSILWVNRAFCDLTGYSEQEVCGKTPRLLKSSEYDHSFYQELWETILSGKVWHGEIRNRKKNGALYFEEMTITPLHSAGDITHFVAIKQDITEKKKLESQYRHAQKMEAVGRLAGGMAHDFNNILSIINGFADLSLDDLQDIRTTATHLQNIKAAVTRAASLTKQLLAFSRQQVVLPKVVCLNDVVSNLTDMIKAAIGDDVSMSFQAMPALGAIEADVGQLEQIVMNLVVNARDAMPDGGEITIKTRNVEVDSVYQGNYEPIRPGAYAMLSISDSGCGMDQTTRARIFEPFFTTKPVGKGTGLGLSTVYGIVKQSDGYIWVYSEPNQGTTFKMFFPTVNKIPEMLGRKIKMDIPLRGSGTVLIVEDDNILQQLLVRILQSAGYNALQANTAEAAIELITTNHDEIQLLLTDVVLPKTSGLGLAESLRLSFPKLKTVFMSGYAAELLSRRNLLPKNAAFLEKPFSKDMLLVILHSVFHNDEGFCQNCDPTAGS